MLRQGILFSSLLILWTVQLMSQNTLSTSDIYSIQIPAIAIENIDEEYNLEDLAMVYQDTTGTLPIEEIQNKKFGLLSDFDPSIDINIYWIRLTIKNNLTYPSQWKLQLFEGWCEKVKVYSKIIDEGENGKWLTQEAGYLTSLDKLDRNPEIKIITRKVPTAVSIILLPDTEKIFYIRYQRKLRAHLSIKLELIPIITAANRLIDFDRKSFYTVVIMGMFFVLAIYHLLVFIMIGDSVYLFYALYSALIVFASTIMDEYGILNYHLFYSSHPSWQPWVFNWIGTGTIACYILFTRSYLDVKERFSKLDIALLLVLGIGIMVSVISSINLVITGRQYLPGMPFPAYMLSLALVFGILLVFVWKKRQASDIFYFLGIGVMLAFILPKHFFDLLGFELPKAIQDWKLPISILQIGILFELLLFSLGLGYRTREVILEKQRFEELDLLKTRFFVSVRRTTPHQNFGAAAYPAQTF